MWIVFQLLRFDSFGAQVFFVLVFKILPILINAFLILSQHLVIILVFWTIMTLFFFIIVCTISSVIFNGHTITRICSILWTSDTLSFILFISLILFLN
jgi:hypothetical protein